MGPLNDNWIIGSDFSELGMKHRKLSEEYLFYKAVAEGNLSMIDKNLKEEKFIESKGVGKLSKNHVVNIKYHFVITTALITRFCSGAGMEIETKSIVRCMLNINEILVINLENLHFIN